MAPRAWTSIRRLLGVVLLVMTSVGRETIPARADSGGTCQAAYGLAPSTMPEWLMLADESTDLTTTNRYDILAAQVLSSGLVDGSSCPSYGLNADGSVNGCGLALSMDQVIAWQNQFDPVILASSQANDLPPTVVKAVIAVESQFWPAANWTRGEIGLGQMTVYGADLVLMWRPDYYQRICRQAFGESGCESAYLFLDPASQTLLQGLVLREMDATCPFCPGGVDLEKGEQAVQVLTETLNASCLQSARLVQNATGNSPAALMSYEDYWRLVLANYHAGSGCVYQALQATGNPHSWGSIAANFSSGCASGAEYIRRIEEQIKP